MGPGAPPVILPFTVSKATPKWGVPARYGFRKLDVVTYELAVHNDGIQEQRDVEGKQKSKAPSL